MKNLKNLLLLLTCIIGGSITAYDALKESLVNQYIRENPRLKNEIQNKANEIRRFEAALNATNDTNTKNQILKKLTKLNQELDDLGIGGEFTEEFEIYR